MDLSSLVVSALSVSLKLTSELYTYGKNVKRARRDIQSLSNELFGLLGVLEHLRLQQEQTQIDNVKVALPSTYSEFQQSSISNRVETRVSTLDSQTENLRLTFAGYN